MKVALVVVLAFVAMSLSSCGSDTTASQTQNQNSMQGHNHDMLKGSGGWCDKCNVGYANGKDVACKGCYDSMKGGEACPMHSQKNAPYACGGCGKTSDQPGSC